MNVKVWGGGGGGGFDAGSGSDGAAGEASTFALLNAGGGQGGINGSTGGSGTGGAGGIASGGTTNTNGNAGGNTGGTSGAGGSNSATGSGAGGAGVPAYSIGNAGIAPGGGGSGGAGSGTPFGGGGGGGAYVFRSYTSADYSSGTSIPLTVGQGGMGGGGAYSGGKGADGRIEIAYTAGGGWDGWIYLGDTGNGNGGISDANGVLSGYVWGGEVVGWAQLQGSLTPLCAVEEGYECTDASGVSGSGTTHSTHTNSWCEQTTTLCDDGCNVATGQCITGAPASGDLCVGALSPCTESGRVRSVQTTTLFWDIQNATSCTVSGTNGDGGSGAGPAWNTVSQTTGVTTGPITKSTRYTLTCLSTDTSTFTDSVIINIVPIFREI